MVTNAIATDSIENILEHRDLFVPFGDWQDQGVSRDEVIESIQKLMAHGFFSTDQDLDHPEFDWDKIAGITLKGISAKIELSLDQQPALDLDDQKKAKKKGSKIDHTIPGLDQFTVGLATYRAKIEADPEADDVKLEVIRLTKLDPESDAVDRFRVALTSHFAGYPKAWEFWQAYKEQKLSGDHGVIDRLAVRIDEVPLTVGIRLYEDGGEFTGMAAIIDIVADAALEEAEVNSKHEALVFFEAFLDRVSPAEEIPDAYLPSAALEVIDGGPAEDPLDDEPLYFFPEIKIKSLEVAVGVHPRSPGFTFSAVWEEAGHLKEKKMSISSSLADEAAAREVAENWLREIL
jgi:hypothetical protein